MPEHTDTNKTMEFQEFCKRSKQIQMVIEAGSRKLNPTEVERAFDEIAVFIAQAVAQAKREVAESIFDEEFIKHAPACNMLTIDWNNNCTCTLYARMKAKYLPKEPEK